MNKLINLYLLHKKETANNIPTGIDIDLLLKITCFTEEQTTYKKYIYTDSLIG